MELLRALMRYYTYAYHGLLALFLFALAALAIASGSHTLQLEMLPWTGPALTYWLLGGSLFGLAAVVLALKGTARALLLVWSIVVVLFMLKGYIFSGYRFSSGEVTKVLMLIFGAMLAVLGAWFGFRGQPDYKSKRYSTAR
ncbi:MAG TPA: hypothetical protein VN442_10125 [Bryobacteraceae bacterium]|nr:hypothetical protein [Bryobacteraceae bacterium]